MSGCVILDSGIVARKNGKRLPCEVLQAENAKLRELAKGLSWCSEERYLGHQESECPLYDERTDGKCRAEALMKELGIEVDDGTK